MLSLNTSRMSPGVVALLFSRGSDLPPLRWVEGPNRSAKKNLDGADDATLLGKASQSEAMAAAVRALLYLWNGWIGECAMHAQLAPEMERNFLLGLTERHQGHAETAKKFFQQTIGHCVYEPLAKVTIDSKPGDPWVKKFADLLVMNGTWEPFAFVDLCDQTAIGKLTLPGIEHVRKLQCHEFGFLMAHCYAGATGTDVLETKSQDAAVQRRAPRPAVKKVSRPAPAPRPVDEATVRTAPRVTATLGVAAPAGPPVKVLCPKCQKVSHFAPRERGRVVRCPGCNSAMLIPLS